MRNNERKEKKNGFDQMNSGHNTHHNMKTKKKQNQKSIESDVKTDGTIQGEGKE